MDRRERRELRDVAATVAAWSRHARDARAWRSVTEGDVRRYRRWLNERQITLRREDRALWSVTPLTRADTKLLLLLAARANLPEIASSEQALSRRLAERAADAAEQAQILTTWRRFVTRQDRKEQASQTASYLRDVHTWGSTNDLPALLERWATPVARVRSDDLTLDDLLDERLGLEFDAGVQAGLIGQASFGELPRALADIEQAVATEAPYVAEVRRAAETLRTPLAEAKLAEMPITELARVTTARLRPDLLQEGGYRTVGAVLADPYRIQDIHGIGTQIARATRKAAWTLRDLTAEETAVRIDPDHRTQEAEALLEALAAWDAVRRTRGAADDLRAARLLAPMTPALTDDVTHLLVTTTSERVSTLQDAIAQVLRRADLITASPPASSPPPADVWADFLARPAEVHALLAELGYLSADTERVYGELPADLVEAVRSQPLRTDHLTVTLRGYQAFAARFALAQRRVVIGDEMGLGKTVEALAVLAHLWATGGTHFLVICPAGLVTNWVREIEHHTDLPVHRLHGSTMSTQRSWTAAGDAWQAEGGIAVTSYSTLGGRIPKVELSGLVVDEAHYAKNPDTHRARHVRERVAAADRVLLLTGTPMENHIDDFTTLLGYIRPEVVPEDSLPPRQFRRAVAPAYLRRNIEDVLTELPELVEVEEWVGMTETDLAAYRVAVADGNFAAMRRAALLGGRRSAKVQRLVEIVAEAEENRRRVLVFSYFRDVVAALADVLPGQVHGPLTGDVAPDRRQRIIDEFSAADHGAVLLSQITTGGVGLNIQAASVVVICEPQLKPTVEAQAIGRAHRMGQLRSVQVHRLLSEGAVDERITEALAAKQAQFDAFARESAMADASPEAVAWADAELDDPAAIVAAEQDRLLYSPPEVLVPDEG